MSLKKAIKNLRTAPDETLITLLLKQFKGLLAERDIDLDTQAIKTISEQAAERAEPTEQVMSIREHLIAIIEESESFINERLKLTFAKSMVTNANLLTGWRTPAEFQELISHKNNAETRIAMGSTLLALLGDARYAAHIFTTVEYEYVRGHMESMLAMRAISFAAQIDPSVEDWEAQSRAILLDNE